MVLSGSRSVSVILCCFHWFSVVLTGSSRFSMILSGSRRFSVVLSLVPRPHPLRGEGSGEKRQDP